MVVRVVIAEDDYLVREGTVALLAEVPDIRVETAVANLDDLLRAVEDRRPDVVLTDIKLPPTQTDEGIRAAREIHRRHPETGVLVLSQYLDEDYAFALLRDGAAGLGYLLKERIADLEELVAALDTVARGGSVVDPRVIEALIARQRHVARSPLADLTPREREVLAEMASGRANRAIADRLTLTERAVEKHINAIFSKLALTEEREGHRRVLAVLTFLRVIGHDQRGAGAVEGRMSAGGTGSL